MANLLLSLFGIDKASLRNQIPNFNGTPIQLGFITQVGSLIMILCTRQISLRLSWEP